MVKTHKNIIFLFLLLAATLFANAGINKLYLSPELRPFCSEPDTTKILYPIPNGDSSPVEDLYNQSPLYLSDPSNIKREVIYDPLTGLYTLYDKVGDILIKTPVTMTASEYMDYQNKKGITEYWRQNRSHNGAATTNKANSIIPPIYVRGKAFETIFGSNTIEIRPQGTIDLTFGIKHNFRDDPSMSDRQKRVTNFDFDQNIKFNVMAKIGDKINFNINQNTKATFNYENKMALKYEGKEDEIIQLIEAGNVSFPLNSTLITGSQQLFGIKSKLKFGKTTISSIFSFQESESSNITVQGGSQTSEFNLTCLNYEENRHFFLSHYFREHYEEALAELPTVVSSINITKIEVWVTNTNSTTQNTRNILALSDLAEAKDEWIYSQEVSPMISPLQYPRNAANTLLTNIDTMQIRNISSVTNYMTGDPLHKGQMGYMVSGRDFEKIENARKLSSTEYTLNSKLGFISLNTTLNSNQSLAVAYQYTIVGSDEVYQVGEFSDQGINAPNVLVAKLLRGTTVNTHAPIWDLMMKNVYNIRAYQVSSADFVLNIFYNGNSNSTPMGYFTEGPEDVKGVSLLHLMGLDNLTQQNNPIAGGDGVFDFLDHAATMGGTINSANGRIYFPVLEPFGSHIRKKIFPDNPELANKYAFDSLYTTTKTNAEQYSEKSRFSLSGYYSSQSGSEISLNAMNVAQGSVTVTAGGVQLTENVDYTVDYTLGRVTIINEGILSSGTPINISLEANSGLTSMRKTFLGARVEHEFNPDLRLGGTVLYLSERSYTQKIHYGEEAIANTIYGADISYHTEARWLTNLIDKLPGISTKAPSKINIDGEFAHFIPGLSRTASEKGTSYLDDFEGAKSTIDLRLPMTWKLASVPQNQPDLFPEGGTNAGIDYGKNRAKLAWYNIDHSVFYDRYGSLRPANVSVNELSKNTVRQVLETEIFPTKDIASGTPTNISMLNLAYYPEERGPYNYDVNPSSVSSGINSEGNLLNPQSRWAGIMRKMESTDFEATNIEYIEFWLMDPFADEEYANNPGKLYINLGDISEDILRDGRKFYENGLPTDANVINVDTTIWGRVPVLQDIVSSFSNVNESRQYQDLGFDGLNDDDERSFFDQNSDLAENYPYLQMIRNSHGESSEAYRKAYNDPSGDNYHHFRGSDYDTDDKYESILERYKNYNGPQGNSPSESQWTESYSTSSTTLPDNEDINNDNTLSESERYYQYEINLDPNNMVVGKNHISDIFEASNIALANGEVGSVKWFQFRIPIKQPDRVVGSIEDYSSIRFMRMFLRGFNKPVVLRFATLNLVRGEWRQYSQSLLAPGEYQPTDASNETTFDISAVNLEENGRRSPVPYVLPPDIDQEVLVGMTATTRLNEQSLQMTINNLGDGDSRAIYKTTSFDFRQYKYLKMFVHAEAANEDQPLNDKDLTVFMRLGTDFTENYYEYEIPLKVTPWYTAYTNRGAIWPSINDFNILLEDLVTVKNNRNSAMQDPASTVQLNKIYSEVVPKGSVDGVSYYHTIKVIGNPSISNVEAMMIGVRNPRRQGNVEDDGQEKSAIVWVNEMRLTELSSKGGFAGTGRLEATLADLGRLVVSGSYKSAGFGALDSKVLSNKFEASSSFSVATDLELGKFFEKTGLKIPMHFDYGFNKVKPLYNPYQPDVKLKETLSLFDTKGERDSLVSTIHDFTQYKNINFMNVRKERVLKKKNATAPDERGKKDDPNNPNRGINSQNQVPKVHIYDIENFSLSFSYSETNKENPDIQYYTTKNYRGIFSYNYAGNPKNVAPFANKKWASNKWLQIIKDFNFYYLPKSMSFNTEMYRNYSEKMLRNKTAGLIIMNPMYSKEWNWSRDYQLRFDLTRALSLEYTAKAQAYIYEPAGNPDKGTEEYKLNRDTIRNELRHFGSMSQFNQNVNISYTLPINKIPLFSWITSNVSYQGSYYWTASARSMQSRLGNTIENSGSIQGNANLDFTKLYNKVPYFKKINTPSRNTNVRPKEKTDIKSDTISGKKTEKNRDHNFGKALGDNVLRFLMMVKRVSVNYSYSYGQHLPGFMQEAQYLGMNGKTGAPGFGFVMGGPSNIYDKAVEKHWLSLDSILSEPYTRRSTTNLTARANVEPIMGLKIDVSANRTFSDNMQHYFRADQYGQYNIYTPTQSGNFNMSYFMWKTAFKKTNDKDAKEQSVLFDNMLKYRSTVANRLADGNSQWDEAQQGYVFDSINGEYYPKGYGASSPEVLMYSFIAAYSGTSPEKVKLNPFPKIPLPNWSVTYNGLTNIPALSKVFKTISLMHTYRSSYSISSWATNVNYDINNTVQTYESSDYIIPRYDISQMVLTEQFSPLIGVDLGFQNSLTANFQYKKSRTLTLSFTNNQLTEINGREIVIGAGYRFKDLGFSIKSLTGNPNGNVKKVKNDLLIKVDLGFRRDKTVLRRIDERNSQVSAGQNKINIYVTADYTLSQNISAQVFFKRDMNNPFIQTSFKTSTTFAGITLRLTLMQ